MAVKRITEAEMNEQGVIAAPDILNGTPAQNKAIFDRMVRQLVAPAVNACADAVEEVEKSQEEVTENEAVRVEAEETRQTNEEGRVLAENGRVSAEEARTVAEGTRQTNEAARVLAEQQRQGSEANRDKAEQTRRSNEELRIAAEQERQTNERNRMDNEALRAEAEEGRRLAETGRINEEEERVNAEKERQTNEEERTAAEQAREEAEARREATVGTQVTRAIVWAENANAHAEGGKVKEITETEQGPLVSTGEEVMGAKRYANQAQVYANGGICYGLAGSRSVETGAANFADKAKAYAEGGSYQEYAPGALPDDPMTTVTVEKGAKQYAAEAEKARDEILASGSGTFVTRTELFEEQGENINTVVIDGDETVNVDISGNTGISGDGFVRVADIPEGIDPFDYFNFTIDVTVEQMYEQTYTESVSSGFGEVFGETDEGEPIIVGKLFASYSSKADGIILFVFQDNAEVTRNMMGYNFAGVVFPKTGVYLRSLNAYNNEVSSSVVTISQTFVFDGIELTSTSRKIKAELLPENIGGGLFIAEYGVTTSAEIEAAYQAGMTLACLVNGSLAYLMVRTGEFVHLFNLNGTTYMCAANNWSTQVGGKLVPPGEADDEGKVLTVVDGEPAWAEPELLPQDMVRYTAQSLTEAQQAQARENIGAVASWADLPDKPFGASPTGGDTLTWDGNTEGLEMFQLPDGDGGVLKYYRVSAVALTKEDVSEGYFLSYIFKDTPTLLEISGEEAVAEFDDGGAGFLAGGYVLVIPEDNHDGVPCLKGTYFYKSDSTKTLYTSKLVVPGYEGFPVMKPISAELLPENIGGLPEHTTADNGKFLRLVNGAPAWATVQNAEEVSF